VDIGQQWAHDACGVPRASLWVQSSSTGDPRLRGALPSADIAPRQELLFRLEHVNGETVGINLVIHVGPKAIHLIALDIFDGHQWSS
jgi:hypothetical protein